MFIRPSIIEAARSGMYFFLTLTFFERIGQCPTLTFVTSGLMASKMIVLSSQRALFISHENIFS